MNEWGESAMERRYVASTRMRRSEQKTKRSESNDGGDGVWYPALFPVCVG